MIASRLAAASLSLSLTVGAMPAQAQSNADPEEIASAVRFGLPALFEGYRTRCSATLSPEGFVAQNAERLAAKFADGADARWPEAKGALLSLGTDEGLEPDLVAGMPDEALKPFVTGILQQMAATEIQPDQCSDVERGLELLDPLPADNIAGLIGFIVEIAGDTKDPASALTGASE